MRRRELLVAGATIAIAGCSSDATGDEPSDENDTDPADENSTVPANGSNTTDIQDDPIDEPEPEEDPKPEEDSEPDGDPDTEPEPEPEPKRAAEHLSEAADYVDRALYVYTVDIDGSFIDITAADGIQAEQVTNRLTSARDEIEKAREYVAEDQESRLEQLEAVVEYLEIALEADLAMQQSYSAATDVMRAVYRENFIATESAFETFKTALEKAVDGLSRLKNEPKREIVSDSEFFGNLTLTRKDRALEGEQDDANQLIGLLNAALADDGIPAWTEGVRQYFEVENEGNSLSPFRRANDTLGEATVSVSAGESAFGGPVANLSCALSAIAAAADELYDAAHPNSTGTVEAAQSDLEECETSREFASCRTVLDAETE